MADCKSTTPRPTARWPLLPADSTLLVMHALRRMAGAALLVAAYAPLHRLLDTDATGPAGAATLAAAEAAWTLGLSGTVIVLAFAWVFTRMVPAGTDGDERIATWRALLERPRPVVFASLMGLAATTLTVVVALGVHEGAPSSVDEMVQLLHAQAVAAGRLTVPVEGSVSAWVVQNGVITTDGWTSIYPPLHTLALAAGLTVGMPWLVGPLAIGTATALSTSSAERLVGVVPGRMAGLLLTVSPFWLLLGSTHSSHATAAAAICLVLWTALRATSGGLGWAVAVGAALGAAVTARPLVGLAYGSAVVVTLWASMMRSAPKATLRRLGAVVVGSAPFAVLLFGWNAALHGHPLRLGYTAAFGDAHGLGFHTDPWGNRYGPLEAVAYTGADLVQLGVRLFESPLPALAVIGAALLLRPLRAGSGVFVAWAAAGIIANAVYWHHGINFGPRMLFETIPAWVVLFTTSAAALLEAPARGAGRIDASPTAPRFTRWSIGVAVVGGLALAPSAILAPTARAPQTTVPAPPSRPAIVFVHGTWASRISAKLADAGMRRDSIETALRRNDVCAVDRYARWRGGEAPPGPGPSLDLEPAAGTPPGLAARALSPGNMVRVGSMLDHDAACIREARADRLGVLELELVAWRFPPLPRATIRVARDLGPVANLRLLRSAGATPYVMIDTGRESGPLLLDYDTGMQLLWGGAAAAADEPPYR